MAHVCQTEILTQGGRSSPICYLKGQKCLRCSYEIPVATIPSHRELGSWTQQSWRPESCWEAALGRVTPASPSSRQLPACLGGPWLADPSPVCTVATRASLRVHVSIPRLWGTAALASVPTLFQLIASAEAPLPISSHSQARGLEADVFFLPIHLHLQSKLCWAAQHSAKLWVLKSLNQPILL